MNRESQLHSSRASANLDNDDGAGTSTRKEADSAPLTLAEKVARRGSSSRSRKDTTCTCARLPLSPA